MGIAYFLSLNASSGNKPPNVWIAVLTPEQPHPATSQIQAISQVNSGAMTELPSPCSTVNLFNV